jgi:hypothetical protein
MFPGIFFLAACLAVVPVPPAKPSPPPSLETGIRQVDGFSIDGLLRASRACARAPEQKSHALDWLLSIPSNDPGPDAPTDLDVQKAFSRLPIHRSTLAYGFDWPRKGQISYLCERIDYYTERTVFRRDFGPWIASHHTRWRCLVQSNELMLWDDGNGPVGVAEVIIDKWREQPSDSIGDALPRLQSNDTPKKSIWFESNYGFRRIYTQTFLELFELTREREMPAACGIW